MTNLTWFLIGLLGFIILVLGYVKITDSMAEKTKKIEFN